MVKKSQQHGIEMAEKGDEEHIKVMGKMREAMKDSETIKAWVTRYFFVNKAQIYYDVPLSLEDSAVS